MARKWIRRTMPTQEWIVNNKWIQKFGTLLNHPKLWHLNRKSAATAAAIGGFIAFVPIPGQSLMATALAILFKVNLPISVAGVFITNPLTMPVIYYFTYKLGAFCLDMTPVDTSHIEMSVEFMIAQFASIGKPFLLGSLICAIATSTCCYFGISLLWRYSVIRDWKRRKQR